MPTSWCSGFDSGFLGRQPRHTHRECKVRQVARGDAWRGGCKFEDPTASTAGPFTVTCRDHHAAASLVERYDLHEAQVQPHTPAKGLVSIFTPGDPPRGEALPAAD